MNKQLWIGFAEVLPLAECKLLDEAKGAYVHVMAWANTADDFRATVVKRATELALVLVDLRETEPWSIRSSGDDPLRDEFFEMHHRLRDDTESIAFGRFHAWFQDQPVGEKQPSALSPQHSETKSRTAEPTKPQPKAGSENSH